MPKQEKKEPEQHQKLTKKYFQKIEYDDISIRRNAKQILVQAQEYLASKESEIANEDAFDARIKTIENLLSGLRIVTEEIGTSVTSAELFFKIAKINGLESLSRISEMNAKVLALANELTNQVKSDSEFAVIKEKTSELRELFSTRQKILSTTSLA